jgi:ribose 5-phosphate isomerase RpiB
MAESIVRTWLHADFDGGRHAQRVEKIEGTA